MDAWNDFSNWASSTTISVEKDIGSFATGVADNTADFIKINKIS